jgi:hypothetical protein
LRWLFEAVEVSYRIFSVFNSEMPIAVAENIFEDYSSFSGLPHFLRVNNSPSIPLLFLISRVISLFVMELRFLAIFLSL